ncbi:hypothetical protein NP233_g3165 [Leucocoprinus birnbaumii]|uniref:Uncharacterized protein n=1 Tax=Leucocoprinus birnbaumii TaxID=56174 RepID=A0AAD5YU74_9AGAR|nr:hypothetical protein NP233_g3165 [Leucocoprinus birnbaumii]
MLANMFVNLTLKSISTSISKPFTVLGAAFRAMFSTIKGKMTRQSTQELNSTEYTNMGDVEAAGAAWAVSSFAGSSPPSSFPQAFSRVIPPPSFYAPRHNVATNFFEIFDDHCTTSYSASSNNNGTSSPSPLQPIANIPEPDHHRTPAHQQRRRKNLTSISRDILKKVTRNARVSHTRAKRHSILFGDGGRPGLAESVVMPANSSLYSPNVFARSELQQKRIRRARALRYHKLFGNNTVTEAGSMILTAKEQALVAAALGVPGVLSPPVQEPAEVPEETNSVPGLDSGDIGYATTESDDDLPTPPLTPPKRARVVNSASYGGSINYSIRRSSRSAQDLKDIVSRMNYLCVVPSDRVISRIPRSSPIAF